MADLSYEATVQPDALPGRPNPRFPDEVTPQAYGAAVGQGIENAGYIIQGVHDKVVRQAQQTQLADAHNQMQALSLQLTHDPQNGAFTKQGKNAFGLDQQYLPLWDQGVQSIVASVQDPKARQAAQIAAAGMRNQLNEQLDTHELSQHARYNVQTAQASIKIAQQAAAANYNNPNIIASNRDTVDVSLQNLAQQQGWSDEETQEATHQAHVDLYQGVLSSMLTDKKIDMAKSFVASIPEGDITPAERKVATLAIQKGEADQTAQGVVDTFRNMGPTLGAKALSQVDKLDDPDLRSATYTAVEHGLSQWHAEAQQVHGDAIMGLEARLASGKTTANDVGLVYQLHQQGALTSAEAGTTIGRIQKAQEKGVEDDSWLRYASSAYQNATPLDPRDKDVKGAVDAVFQNATQGTQPGSQEWINRGADIAQRTGVTPDSLISWSRSQLVSANPAQAAQAAMAIERVSEANPRGTPFALDDKDKAMAKIINDAVIAGTDPATAVTNAREIQAMPDAEKLRLGQMYDKKQYAATAEGALRSELKNQPEYKGGFFQGLPDLPPSMTGQFEELRQNYFTLTGGDKDKAADLAMRDLKNTWGITQVNGKREFMQYAPEAHTGITTDALRADMVATATGHAADPSKVRLTPTADTAGTNGQVWALSVPDKFGAYDVIRDANHNPIPYQIPDPAKALADQRKKEADAGLARLKAAQAQEDEISRNQFGQETIQGRRVGAY
jgi:hypothetical protein